MINLEQVDDEISTITVDLPIISIVRSRSMQAHASREKGVGWDLPIPIAYVWVPGGILVGEMGPISGMGHYGGAMWYPVWMDPQIKIFCYL
jgi:hypothetical protein